MTIDLTSDAEWALLDPLNSEASPQAPVWKYIIVHHTGAEEKNTEQIRRYHKSLGWRDIGYHYVIERDGRLVPGRSDSLPGAHCVAGKMNYQGLGVALIGNFECRSPYSGQLETLETLLLYLMFKYQIPVVNVMGHGTVHGAATKCPGKLFNHGHLMPLRLEINGRVSPARVRLVDGRSEMLTTEDQWVHIPSLIKQLGGNTRWSEATRAVIAQIW
jgi:N-acetyl-anhydromuramyl-L-alanine amidase AmpD